MKGTKTMRYHFTAKSRNKKTGPIPVTMTEKKSCPQTCPLKDGGCYADGWPLSLHWEKVASAGITLKALCDNIKALPAGQLWRMNAAGDLPGNKSGHIAPFAMRKLVTANAGRNGFTYTHHNTGLKGNRQIIRTANRAGFTINLSGNSLGHADTLKALNIAPVVVVLPIKARDNLYTPAGHRVVICPAVTGKTASCASCGLCAKPNRQTIIGFPAHGIRKRQAENIATANPERK
jgi:hypothetical protein